MIIMIKVMTKAMIKVKDHDQCQCHGQGHDLDHDEKQGEKGVEHVEEIETGV